MANQARNIACFRAERNGNKESWRQLKPLFDGLLCCCVPRPTKTMLTSFRKWTRSRSLRSSRN